MTRQNVHYVVLSVRAWLNRDPCPTQPQSQSSTGDPRDATVVEGQRRIGKFGKFSHSSHSGKVT